MFIKSHNVRVNSGVTKDQKSFIKECRWDINFIYDRYSNFYSHISNIENLSTPKIIKIYDENNIEFEYTDLGKSLKELIESNQYSNTLFYDIGKKLGELHLKLNNGTIPNQGVICGDFCTWNIFINEEKLYFIDFEPPFRILESEKDNIDFLTKNNYLEDIGQFIFRLENILIPSKPMLFFKSFQKEKGLFLKGYEETTKTKIPNSGLKEKLNTIAKMEISSERNFRNTITFIMTKIIFKYKYNV